MSVLGMRLIHRGTVRRYGSSPGTPVVTGQHRSGGRAGLNALPTFAPPDNAPHYPIMGDHELDSTFARAELGDNLYWGSNAPVPKLLEEGLSAQARTGFLGHSVDQAKIDVEATEWDG